MKKIIISAVILLFFSTISGAEVKNKILYDNKAFDLCCNLLEPLYIKTGNSDWCNYGSVWEIKENTLYLLGLDNDLSAGYKKADMKELFGEKYRDGKVKAEWFTGEICIPDGKVFQQINDLCIFERSIEISIENGRVTKSIVFDNTKKTASAKKKSMLTAVINPDKSIFGINYGTTEGEFIARFGQPTKCREIEKAGKEMMYGRKYSFLFKKAKLVGMYTAALEHEVYQIISSHENFDYLEWELSNGIKKNMNLADVKKVLETEGLTTKDVIISLPGKTLDITQKVINLPIEAVKKITQVITPSKTQDTVKIDPNKPGVSGPADTLQQKILDTTAAQTETAKITAPVISLSAKGLEMAAGLPEKTIDVTQKVINLPIEAVKKVTQAVFPSKSADNDQREFTDETGPKLSFSTEKACVEISLKHEDEKKNTDEAYIVSEILIRLK